MVTEYVPPRYPILGFIAGSGTAIAVVLGCVLFLCGVYAAWWLGAWFIAGMGLVLGLLVGGLLASYAEMARIVMETLVPR